MCRWFCLVSQEQGLLEDLFVRPKHSIIKQIDEHYLPDIHIQFQASDTTSSPNVTTNMDGYGVAYWTTAAASFDRIAQERIEHAQTAPQPGQLSPAAPASLDRTYRDMMRPVVYRSIRPALNDLNLRSLVAGTASRGVLAHIRAGTGLTPVVETNNHPFVFGRYAFAHNGVLAYYASLRLRLLAELRIPLARAAILGTTDSEHIAALLFDRLVGGNPDEWAALMRGKRYPVTALAAAMREVLAELESWIREIHDGEETHRSAQHTKHAAHDAEHSALNLVVTEGSSLVATRYASPQPREPPSLYLSTAAAATMNRLYEGNPDLGHPQLPDQGRSLQQGPVPREQHSRCVIVASEPSTYDKSEWNLVPAQHMVIVGDDYVPIVEPI